MPAWIVFLLSGAVVVIAGARLSRDGDVIAERTGLGGAWVGAILVAGATSLPELVTDLFAVRQGHTSLAVGDLFGSCMANMLILAVADLSTRQVRVLTRVAINQVLVGALSIALMTVAAAAVLARLPLTLLGLGWGSLLVGAGYVLGMRLLHVNRAQPAFGETGAHSHLPPQARLRGAILGFSLAGAAIPATGGALAGSAAALAEQLGISSGFAGMVLLAITTSLPEVTVSIAAVRAGAYDLAVGNLLGSNCFNMFILVALDLADGSASLLAGVEPGLALGALVAILLVAQALMGILHRSERRVWYLEPDAGMMALTYLGGLYLVFRAGGD